MKNLSYFKAFTLVELLVVAGIISIMALLMYANYRAGQQRFALQRSANKLAQDIRRAQQMAMALQELPSGEVPEMGYGIKITPQLTPREYLFYGNRDDDVEYSPANDEVVDILELEKEVEFDQKIIATSGGTSYEKTKVHIVFVPPDPTIWITLPGPPTTVYDEVWITLLLEQEPNVAATIFVNKAGLITVE